jgi:hypothetical protein
MIHVWHLLAPFEARGQQAIERAGVFMAAHVAPRVEARSRA